MNEFRSEGEFPTFYCLFVFFASKAAPTKVKASRRKPRRLGYRVYVKRNLPKKIRCRKKIKYSLPGESEPAAVLKAVITVPIILAHILFSA